MKKIELVKFIFGILFCSIAFFGAILFFLGYFSIAVGSTHEYDFYYSFSQIWCSRETGVHSYSTIFLAICGVCGSYLLKNVKSRD